MIRGLPLALAFVLFASTDWALVIQGQPPICAKSYRTCEAARAAIAKGWLPGWAPPDAPTSCEPAAAPCFKAQSLCIANFNCEAR